MKPFPSSLLALILLTPSTPAIAADPGTSGWAAWLELPSHQLHIMGAVLAPTPGYKALLKRPPGSDQKSKECALELVLTEPEGEFWPELATSTPVAYDETPCDCDFVVFKDASSSPVKLAVQRVYTEWRAQLDPVKGRLHIMGAIVAPSPGYQARLEPAKPQGFSSEDYLLDLVLTGPKAASSGPPSRVPVDYVEMQYHASHTTITVKDASGIVATMPVRKIY